MPQGPKNTIRIFRAFGIDVYLHWLWLAVPVYFVSYSGHQYSSPAWDVADCLVLFLIVLMHEFGHSLACRSVGGKADTIMLWPLGGVAYVDPPQRPGPVLWSIAAGPLVNVVLFFVLTGLTSLDSAAAWTVPGSDLHLFLRTVWWTNVGLLLFNILPIYPLDGGQILRALLWFVLGRTRSLFAVTILGFIGVAGLGLLAYSESSIWMGLITYYALQRCLAGFAQARALQALDKMPRRDGFACPSCGIAPPIGALWRCHQCGTTFDTFETQAVCPHCQTAFSTTRCINCGESHPMATWRSVP